MAKCVYDGKGYLPECEHCIDTVGTGVVCTHDCVIELREEIEKRDSLIRELADAFEKTLCDFECEKKGTCTTELDDTDPIVDCPAFKKRELIAKAREVAK